MTDIDGIGPVIEKKLVAAGVTTIAQIAAWTAEDIAKFDEELSFKGRIEREEWVKQAQAKA
ncbi:MAG: helix-hairpin-helix domain-containing protein [Arenicella sp.]